MKTRFAAIILGALALNVGATAQAKPHGDAQLRQLSRTFGQSGPRVTVDVPRVPAPGGTYESYSLGRRIPTRIEARTRLPVVRDVSSGSSDESGKSCRAHSQDGLERPGEEGGPDAVTIRRCGLGDHLRDHP
jgi:hypothetical protein